MEINNRSLPQENDQEVNIGGGDGLSAQDDHNDSLQDIADDVDQLPLHVGGFDVEELEPPPLRSNRATISSLEDETEGEESSNVNVVFEESATPTTELEEGSLIEDEEQETHSALLPQQEHAQPSPDQVPSDETQLSHEQNPTMNIESNDLSTLGDLSVVEEDEDDDGETTREFLIRLSHKIGKSESDVLPFIEKLEKEWLLQKVQLKTMSEEGFVGRLGFPLGLVQQIREELGVLQPQVSGMLKYKFEIKQQEQEKEAKSGPGRKRKRLTVTEWSAKVEQFARNTKHSPSPFRVASIFQVECYCCGYAVNMNKPGQLYYLKRHVEGVRPDIRTSNHYKNYQRWRQQYQGSDGAILLPQLKGLPANKKFKSSRGPMDVGLQEMLPGEEDNDGKLGDQQLDDEVEPVNSQHGIVTAEQANNTPEFALPDMQHLEGFGILHRHQHQTLTLDVVQHEVYQPQQIPFDPMRHHGVPDAGSEELRRQKALEHHQVLQHHNLQQQQEALQHPLGVMHQQLQQSLAAVSVHPRFAVEPVPHQLLQLHYTPEGV